MNKKHKNMFHIPAATTENARSPTVASHVVGTTKAELTMTDRRCRPGIPATGGRVRYRSGRPAQVYEGTGRPGRQ